MRPGPAFRGMSTTRNREPHALNDARVTLRPGARMVFDGGIFFDGVPALDGLVWSVDPATGLADVEFGNPGTRSAVRGHVAVADLVVCTERLYHVVAIYNARRVEDRSAEKKTYLTRTPVTIREGHTIINKHRPSKNTRVQVEDTSCAAPITRDGTLESELVDEPCEEEALPVAPEVAGSAEPQEPGPSATAGRSDGLKRGSDVFNTPAVLLMRTDAAGNVRFGVFDSSRIVVHADDVTLVERLLPVADDGSHEQAV